MAGQDTPTRTDGRPERNAALHSNATAAATEGAEDTGEFASRAHRRPLLRVLDLMASACMLVAGLQLVFLIASFGWLVWGRYVMNNTPTWVEQSSLLLVVWITFLGGAASVWRGTHLSVDFVREAMPEGPRNILRWIAVFGVALFGGVMTWQGWLLADGTWARRIPMLGVAEGWRAVPMAVSGALIVVFSLAHFSMIARGEYLADG
jgi:TRAP-type C4-dicarboxylate transport system permease small subunit